MSGPWEDYAPQSKVDAGPWNDYAPSPQATGVGNKPWKAPGGLLMGLGDALKGGLETGLHGAAWIADKVAPNAQITKDIHEGITQLGQTMNAQEAAYQANAHSRVEPDLMASEPWETSLVQRLLCLPRLKLVEQVMVGLHYAEQFQA